MAVAPKPKQSPTANQELVDRGIQHAIALERLKASEAKRVADFVDQELLPELLAKLEARLGGIEERGLDIGPVATSRLRELIRTLQISIDPWAQRLASDLLDRLGEIARFEAQWQVSELSNAVAPLAVTVETVLPSVATLREIVMNRPIDGQLIQPLVEKFGANTKAAIDKELRLGIASGETTGKITRRLKQVVAFRKGGAEAIVRTATGHAASVGRDAAYAANADLIRGIQLVETLDTRTCPRCMALDGRVYKIGEGPRPLHHINCRGSTAPVLKSFRELGIGAADLPESTRASFDGQVAGKVTYSDWLRRRSAAEQDDALGPTRGKLYRTGKIEITEFVNRSGDLLTLEQLRARYSAAFRKAGI